MEMVELEVYINKHACTISPIVFSYITGRGTIHMQSDICLFLHDTNFLPL